MITDELAAGRAGHFSCVVAGQGVDALLDQLFAGCVEEQRTAPGVQLKAGQAHDTPSENFPETIRKQ